jgi:hypothetical protein
MIHEEKETLSVAQKTERYSTIEEPEIRPDDIEDGDLALKVLHTHFEPYSKEEEKRVLRKIDYRLASLMLLVNGIQFVDKLVIVSRFFPEHTQLTNIPDDIAGCNVWARYRSSSEGSRILAAHKHLLHRLPHCTIPNEYSYATIPNWEIYHRQSCSMGHCLDLHGFMH